jgi:acyl-CoA thioesterase-2
MNDNDRAKALLELLDLETIDRDLFRGAKDPMAEGRVFGGQVVAQALMAATRTVDPGRQAHSLHAYFVRPGDDAHPIIYHVDRDRDGGSFSNRRVVAQQNGETILNMIASFHIDEDGFHHAADMPAVVPPEDLPTEAEMANSMPDLPERFRSWLTRPRSIEIRRESLDAFIGKKMPPQQNMWFRLVGEAPEEGEINRAVLSYASDFALLGTAMLPHGIHWSDGNLRSASIDHAVWFHATPKIGDWHLYTMESPWSGGARGYCRGRIYSQDGRLIASTAQEGLMRFRPKTGEKPAN